MDLQVEVESKSKEFVRYYVNGVFDESEGYTS
jgi:hypothetical protein